MVCILSHQPFTRIYERGVYMIQGNLVMRYRGGDAGLVGLSKEYSGDICVLTSKMRLLCGPWLEDFGYHNECATRSMYLAIAMKRCYFHSLDNHNPSWRTIPTPRINEKDVNYS
jgi:hypothetical protein